MCVSMGRTRTLASNATPADGSARMSSTLSLLSLLLLPMHTAFVLAPPLAHSSPLCALPSLPRPAIRPSPVPTFSPSFCMLDVDAAGTKESPWAHGLTPILLIGERLAAALSLALRTTLAQLCPPQLVHQTKRFVHAIQTAAPMQLATRLLEQERRALFPPLEIVTQPVDVEVLPAEEQPKRIYLKQLCLPECSSNPDM